MIHVSLFLSPFLFTDCDSTESCIAGLVD